MPLGGGNADALFALAPIQLSGLASVIAKHVEDRPSRSEEAVLTRSGCQLGEPRSEDEATLHVTRDEAVMLKGYRQPMSGGAG